MRHPALHALLLAPGLLANDRVEFAAVSPDLPPPFAFHGIEAARDGERLVISVPQHPTAFGPGRVFVYERRGLRWFETAQFAAAESIDDDRFGDGLALQGDLLIVGATGRDDNADKAGAAYVFEHTAAGWVEQAKLPHVSNLLDGFGHAIDVDGDTIVVGSKTGENVHVYRASGGSWTLEAVLAGPGYSNAEFGFDVAIDGDLIVVGAPHDGQPFEVQGATYVYERTGNTWSLDEAFTATPYFTQNYFGHSVDVDGDRVLASTNSPFTPQSTFVFRRDASGWREEGRLKPLPGADHDSFGQSVALSGDLAFVASRDNELVPNNAGVIDWYLLDGSGWTHAGRLLGSEPASGAYLGWALDIEGRTVVASSWGVDGQAGAYFFSLDCDRQRNYCPSTLNSSGTPAVMSSTGSQHIGANDFTLVAEGCPANTSAIFVYAEDPRRQALGDGFLCLDPARSGVIDLSPVLRTDNGGHVERLLDFPGLPVAGEILAGTTWYFQCLFRDPSAGGTGLNLTDGLEVNFCP